MITDHRGARLHPPPALQSRQDVEAAVARRTQVHARMCRVLRENLQVHRSPEEIDPDTPLFGTGLAFDSVDAVELAVGLEAEFGVTLPEDSSSRRHIRTVNTLVDFVLSRPGARLEAPP